MRFSAPVFPGRSVAFTPRSSRASIPAVRPFWLSIFLPAWIATLVSPWGQPAKGKKTRNNKGTDRFIIRRRKKK